MKYMFYVNINFTTIIKCCQYNFLVSFRTTSLFFPCNLNFAVEYSNTSLTPNECCHLCKAKHVLHKYKHFAVELQLLI